MVDLTKGLSLHGKGWLPMKLPRLDPFIDSCQCLLYVQETLHVMRNAKMDLGPGERPLAGSRVEERM